MNNGQIILITKNYRVKQLENILFLITKEKDENILQEDGIETVGHILIGYVSAALPNGQVRVVSPTKYTLLSSDIEYKKLADCYYVNIPHIINVITDETENQN